MNMNRRLTIVGGLCCFGLASCASSPAVQVLPAAGPDSVSAAMAPPTGALIVYSRQEEVNDGGVLSYPYSSYEIRSSEGAPLRSVRNHLGLTDQEPERLDLPEGRYLVRVECAGVGRVTVPVIVVRRKTTIVRLDSDPKTGRRCAPIPATGPQPFG
jgi:hypothetical protein